MSFMNKIFNIGVSAELSPIEMRYVRVTNIAAWISIAFMSGWTLIAVFMMHNTFAILLNLLGVLLFGTVLLLNQLKKNTIAPIAYYASAIIQLAIHLYLYGYESGVHLVCFVLILVSYATIPRKKRFLSTILAVVSLLYWTSINVYSSEFPVRYPLLDSHAHFTINAVLIFGCSLLFLLNMSQSIDQAEYNLLLEKEKSDNLLHKTLPENIADRLKKSPDIIADNYESVSVLFADIVGFTKLSEQLAPSVLVQQLNEIFTVFDELVEKYELEKIKTIGDAYMVSSGVPKKIEDHAKKLGLFALEIIDFLESRNASSRQKLHLRIGIHTGPVIAGVIGTKKFSYDLWGDTVNTASRMESHGSSGKIQVSEAFRKQTRDIFEFEKRKRIEVKGKGKMQTYFLISIK